MSHRWQGMFPGVDISTEDSTEEVFVQIEHVGPFTMRYTWNSKVSISRGDAINEVRDTITEALEYIKDNI